MSVCVWEREKVCVCVRERESESVREGEGARGNLIDLLLELWVLRRVHLGVWSLVFKV